ncbi:MAG: hypothetical protein BGO68_05230 [Candidatus Amoebophilus sp. 36-38]|nr:MAG: hypothetical protein BGO68_05230 [Candidatus Amoebophilus sp. 36-38]
MNSSTITKKNNRKLLPWFNLFIFFLITLTTLVSCENCTKKGENKDLGSITNIEVDKSDLLDPARHFTLKLILEDDKKTVNLADYELVATITNGKGKLVYTIFEEADRTEKKEESSSIIRELAQFFKTAELGPDDNSNSQADIPFDIIPDPTVDQMTIQLELFKKTGDNKESKGTAKVAWKKGAAPVTKIDLINLKDVVGSDVATFKLKNESGAAIKPSEINLTIAGDNDVKFQFCQKDGTMIAQTATLKDILGNDNAIQVGQETGEIYFKFESDPSNKKSAIVTITAKHGTNSIQKQVQWTNTVATALELIDLQNLIGGQVGKFKLKNGSGSAIKPSEINLTIAGSDGVEFQFCQGDGTPIVNPATLQNILGNDNDIQVSQETGEIYLKFKKGSKSSKSAQVTVAVKKGTYTTTASATWNAANIMIDFASIDEKIKGTVPIINFTVKNSGNDKLEKNKFQIGIKRDNGNSASIKNAQDLKGGIYKFDLGNLEIDPQTTSAQQTIEIVPGTDKKATFTLQPLYNGSPVGTEKTVIWKEQDVELALTLTADKDKIHYKIENKGTDVAQGVTLTYKPEAGTTATLGTASPIAIADIAAPGIQEQDLAINWGGSTSGNFKFTLTHPTEGDQTQPVSVNAETPTIKVELADPTKVTFVDAEKTVKIKFTNTGTKDLDEAALKAVTFGYGKTTTAGTLCSHVKEDINNKNLWELLALKSGEVLGQGDAHAKIFDLTIENEGEAEVGFEHIKLNNSTEKGEIANITWEGTILNVSISSTTTKLEGDKSRTVEIQITNNSGFKLDQKQLEKLVLQCKKSLKGKLALKKIQDVENKTLWELLQEQLNGSFSVLDKDVNLDLAIDNEKAAEVEFKDIELKGSTSASVKIASITWEADLNVAISSTTIDLKGDANKIAQIKITNNSGVKLGEKQLEKLVLKYDKKGKGKLGTKAFTDVDQNNLWHLLGATPLKAGKSKILDLNINNEEAAEVAFTNIGIKGSTDNKKIASIKWKKEAEQLIEISTSDLHIGGNNKSIGIKFEKRLEIDSNKLKNLRIDYKITSGAFKTKKNDEVKDKKLLELLERGDLPKSISPDFTVDTGAEDVVEIKDIKVVDENGDAVSNTIPSIVWEKELKVSVLMQSQGGMDLQALKGVWNRQFTIQFTNQTRGPLSKEDLDKIKVKVAGLKNGAKLKNLTIEITENQNEKSLYELLGIKNDKMKLDRSLGEVTLVLDPGTDTPVDLQLTLEGVTNTEDTSLLVKWVAQPMKVKIVAPTGVDLTKLKGDDRQKVPLEITNESGFELNDLMLNYIEVVSTTIPTGGFIHFGMYNDQGTGIAIDREDNKINDNIRLYHLIVGDKKIPINGKKTIYLYINPAGKDKVNATLELKGSEVAEKDRKVEIKWEES